MDAEFAEQRRRIRQMADKYTPEIREHARKLGLSDEKLASMILEALKEEIRKEFEKEKNNE